MSYSFECVTHIKATRKHHRCWQCLKAIDIGQPSRKLVGLWSDFYCHYTHLDCLAVAHNFARANDRWTEEFPVLYECEREDWPWLIENSPEAVLDRLQIFERQREWLTERGEDSVMVDVTP